MLARSGLIVAVLALLAGCAGTKPIMSPHTRLIYHNGEQGVYTFCDRGNRIYMSERGLAQVVPGGCQDGQP